MFLSGLLPPPQMVKLDHRMHDENYASSLPNYSNYDLSVFDTTGRKRWSDYSFFQTPTLGDGTFHCILEDERAKGIEIMKEAGISIPPTEEFDDLNKAKAFIKKTGKRYVFKPDTEGEEQDTATTYVSKSADDLLEFIDRLYVTSHNAHFILQEFIKGIEVSVNGYFNGTDFHFLSSTLECKKFMNDEIGPNTGCAGNLIFSIQRHAKLYKDGLEKMKEIFQQVGFRGPIDLNTIVTAESLYGLEWTPRFGYDSSATEFSMYSGGLGHLLHATATGATPENSWRAEFGVAVRVTVPPYPTDIRLKKEAGIPIKGIDSDNKEDILRTYLYDVALDKNKLVTAGISGFVAVPIEIGNSIPEAFGKLEDRLKKIQIPDMQYRTDIEKKTSERYYELLRQGWI